MHRKIFIVLAGALLLASCKTAPLGGSPEITVLDTGELPGPDGQTGTDQGYVTVIGPYDQLVIDVLGFEELKDRKISVDGQGNVTLPIAGNVQLSGLTTAQAVERITEQLRRGYVRQPQVAVNIEQSRSQYVTVQGQVQQAGNYPMVANMSLMRAVAAARGETDYAKLNDVVVFRRVNGQTMVALYSLKAIRRGAYPDPAVYPQDVVVVGDSPGRRMFQQFLQGSALFISPLVAILQRP